MNAPRSFPGVPYTSTSTGFPRLVPMYLWPSTFRMTIFCVPLTTAFLSLALSSRYGTFVASISRIGWASICSVSVLIFGLLTFLIPNSVSVGQTPLRLKRFSRRLSMLLHPDRNSLPGQVFLCFADRVRPVVKDARGEYCVCFACNQGLIEVMECTRPSAGNHRHRHLL